MNSSFLSLILKIDQLHNCFQPEPSQCLNACSLTACSLCTDEGVGVFQVTTINAFVWTHISVFLPSHEGVDEASEPINGPSEQCEQRKWFEQMFELLNFPPFHWGARCCLQKLRKKKQIYISPKTTDISNQAQQSKVHKGGIHGHTSCGRVGRGGNARFHTFWLMFTDQPTNQPTDGWTDGQSLL